jgi:hypothetical protein
LEILKHIIACKKEEQEARVNAAAITKRKEKLLAALSAKDDEKLSGMTREEIEAEISKLTI